MKACLSLQLSVKPPEEIPDKADAAHGLMHILNPAIFGHFIQCSLLHNTSHGLAVTKLKGPVSDGGSPVMFHFK